MATGYGRLNVPYAQKTCHPYTVERFEIKQLAARLGIPFLSLDTDYSQSDTGQLTTRIAAFIEML